MNTILKQYPSTKKTKKIIVVSRITAMKILDENLQTLNLKDDYKVLKKYINCYKDWHRVRNYELVEAGLALGYVFNIMTKCPINDFPDNGFTNLQEAVDFASMNKDNLEESHKWLLQL